MCNDNKYKAVDKRDKEAVVRREKKYLCVLQKPG